MSRRLRFGAFVLDLQGPRLIADGRTVRIQPQPLRVLAHIAQRPGDLVTRDELRAGIWGEATFVEFDQGLNYCVRQIRVALGDDASAPRYVETVKGQGYRFVASVAAEPADAPADARATAGDPVSAPVPAPPAAAAAPLSSRASAVAIAATLVATVTACGWLYTGMASSSAVPPPLASPEALTDFADSALAPALSPDGRLVAFIRGNSAFLTPDDIYVKRLPDGEARPLVHDARLKYGPAFSPDGSLLVYTVMEHQGWSTYTVPVAGGEPRLLLENAAGLSWLDGDRLLFAEVRGGQHMGFVTGPRTRERLHDVYFPAHARAMAHFASVSPDRRSVLVVEMDGSGAWAPCRLVGLDGRAGARPIGPPGACLGAAWSPDGRWMYFNAVTEGHAHVWRQRVGTSTPEPVTAGPVDELGLAVAPDGRSLVTSVGVSESTLWFHDGGGDRQLSSEGQVSATSRLSRDGRTIFYLLRRTDGEDRRELHRRELAIDRDDVLLPGVSMREFDVAADGSQIVYTTATGTGSTQLWTAASDGRSIPRPIGLGGERSPHVGPDGAIVARVSDGRANFLQRWHDDTKAWTKVVPYPISDLQSVSPGGRWAMVIAPLLDNSTAAAMAVPLGGGAPVRVCENYCHMSWAADGRALYVSVDEASATSPGRSLAIPVGLRESLPPLPEGGLRPGAPPNVIAGAQSVPRAELSAGRDAATYAYVRVALHRNLYRLPLPD